MIKKTRFLLLLLLCVSLCFTSCDNLIRVTYKDGYYVDTVNNIKYFNASVSYEPVSVGAEYAKYNDIVLYKIAGADPTQWMTEAYEGIGSIFYAEDVALPTLSEMNPIAVYVCGSETKTISLSTVEDADVIAQLCSLIENGEQTEAGSYKNSYYLKFSSEAYPFLYYSVVYIIGDNGGRYAYDRGTKKCVDIGYLLETYFPIDE